MAEARARPGGTPAGEAVGRGALPALAHGPGRLLVAVYGVFAVSAGARAGYQLATSFALAPAAYLLSALAAVVYGVATVALARASVRSHAVAAWAVGVELVGVVVVGALSVAGVVRFADQSVWSGFGSGYGYVPLVLPLLGLGWLWRTRPRRGGAARR